MAQVVQARHAAVRRFGQGLEPQQVLGQGQRITQLAGSFRRIGLLHQTGHVVGHALLPDLAQPVGQLRLGVGLHAGQQLTQRRVLPGQHLHIGRQLQRRAAFHTGAPGNLPQPQQPLAQVGAGTHRRHIGPQQRGQVSAGGRAHQGQAGGQQGRVPIEHRGPAIGVQQRGDASQSKRESCHGR